MAPQTTFYDALALRTSKIVSIIDLLTLAQYREVPIEDLSAAKITSIQVSCIGMR